MKYILTLASFISLMLLAFSHPFVKKKAYDFFLDRLVYRHTVDLLPIDSLDKAEVLLDTRSKREYEVSHLPNAIHIGYEGFAFDKVTNWQKNQVIVLYCSIGYRSERIGEQLREAGYTQVYNLNGGAFKYVNQGLPLEGSKSIQIHPYSMWWGIWLSKGQKKY